MIPGVAAWQEKNLSLWEDADANAHANVDDDDDDEKEEEDDDDGDNGGLPAELVPGFGNPKTTNFFQTGWQFDRPFLPLGFKVPPAWSSWIKKILKDSFFHFSNFNGISGVELRHRQTDMTRPWPLWCDARPLSFEDEDAAVTAAPAELVRTTSVARPRWRSDDFALPSRLQPDQAPAGPEISIGVYGTVKRQIVIRYLRIFLQSLA